MRSEPDQVPGCLTFDASGACELRAGEGVGGLTVDGSGLRCDFEADVPEPSSKWGPVPGTPGGTSPRAGDEAGAVSPSDEPDE